MKKFNTNFNGLLPVFLNDIRFVQEGFAEEIEALLKPFLAFTEHNSFILSGCETGLGVYASGWVVLDGRIYRVPGGSIPEADENTEVVWGIQTNNLPGGAKIPKRIATTVQTWQEETASLVLGIIGVPGSIPVALPRLADIIDLMINADTGWVSITLASGWSASDPSLAPMYRIKNGVIYLRGHIVPAAGAPAVFATLPPPARPSKAFTHANGSTFVGYDYAVLTNGQMTTTTPEAYQVLDGVVYMNN